MSALNIFVIVVSICLIVLVAALVPALIQIKRTARKVETLLDTLNQDLSPLLQSLADTSRELQTLTEKIRDKVDRTDKVIDTAKAAADTLLVTSSMLKNSVTPIFSQITGFTAGVQAFFRYLKKPDQNH
ncbi:MAG: hypothetical protein A2511_09025 [Deltaproteobacteria bacterium RIFOXYD12_FULL_50_9]|nr:MAG: hypothetical protein A2511_09025 [Deltaproteobacteria bacterium RIFOXYD12_FULL_50_9]